MAPVPRGSTVAVTGAAGFIGGWIVKLLLAKGYRVRACVRDINDESRTGFLKNMEGYATRRLTLHEADLNNDGCYDNIFAGCQGVCHVSHVSDYNDLEYIERTCRHIIESVNRSESVNRVVVTSSLAAIISEADLEELKRRPVIYEDREPDEQNPKRTPERGQGYSIGKVMTEQLFAEAAEEHGGWDTVTICPADNVGPILSPHQKDMGPWQHNIEMMLLGQYFQNQAYRPWMPVDVRDDAECHIGVLESTDVFNGERFLAWSTEARNVEDICADISRLFPEMGHDTPPVTDSHPERVQAREQELRDCWAACELRNDRIVGLLDIEFRPLDESIRDCVESLIAVAGVTPKLTEGFSLQD